MTWTTSPVSIETRLRAAQEGFYEHEMETVTCQQCAHDLPPDEVGMMEQVDVRAVDKWPDPLPYGWCDQWEAYTMACFHPAEIECEAWR